MGLTLRLLASRLSGPELRLMSKSSTDDMSRYFFLPPAMTQHIGKQRTAFLYAGGGDGIRTHGTLPYTRFPSGRLKPLGHPSVFLDSPAISEWFILDSGAGWLALGHPSIFVPARLTSWFSQSFVGFANGALRHPSVLCHTGEGRYPVFLAPGLRRGDWFPKFATLTNETLTDSATPSSSYPQG